MIAVAKHVIILVIIQSLATPYAGPHKLFKSFLKLPCCIVERKQSNAVISFEEWKCLHIFKIQNTANVVAMDETAIYDYSSVKNMSKCKYTYFPLYKQVV
jgi:hypothetical protein